MKKLVVKPVILITLFNEAQRTEALISEILFTREEIEVLVVDDDFPNMAASLVEKSPKQTRESICS